ncbi:class A sortase [Lapidilactobacillus luobeiensis]|uniref:class A sortase n=1 Tax=Lapidilactobacillus luobeiensis TaxID=2950371 RepID=UPI0021C44087|nr:class A sortase [Lapidilactobacillus luobeiensis]
MKKKLKIIGLILLLLVSLGLIFNRQIKDQAIKWMTGNRTEQVTKKSIKNAAAIEGEFDFSKVKSIDATQVAKAAIDPGPVGALGKIAIPSVSLYLPILKGLSDTAMSLGAGTMKADQKMGTGNYALAGHYMTNKGILFSPVAQTELGQKIYLTDLDHVYTYQITSKAVIKPEAVAIIDDRAGEKIVTLITCADGGANRWAVQGKLKSVKPATKKTLKVFAH